MEVLDKKAEIKLIHSLPICDWQGVGVDLGISTTQIKTIEKNNVGDETARKREMFTQWLRQDINPTYRKLFKVLQSRESSDMESIKKLASNIGVKVDDLISSFSLNTPAEHTTGDKQNGSAPSSITKCSTTTQTNNQQQNQNNSQQSNQQVLDKEAEIKLIHNLPICDWQGVGVDLGISPTQIKTIEKNNVGDENARKREMFTLWLRQDKNPTYRKLVEVLLARQSSDMESIKTLALNIGVNIEDLILSPSLNTQHTTGDKPNGSAPSSITPRSTTGDNHKSIQTNNQQQNLNTSSQQANQQDKQVISNGKKPTLDTGDNVVAGPSVSPSIAAAGHSPVGKIPNLIMGDSKIASQTNQTNKQQQNQNSQQVNQLEHSPGGCPSHPTVGDSQQNTELNSSQQNQNESSQQANQQEDNRPQGIWNLVGSNPVATGAIVIAVIAAAAIILYPDE